MTFSIRSFSRLGKSMGALLLVSMASAQIDFTEQPQSLFVPPGTSAGFAVSLNDETDVSYQWFRDDSAIAGQTGSMLLINAAQEADAAEYWVRATSPKGSIESNRADLDVIPEELPTTTVFSLMADFPVSVANSQGIWTQLPDGKILLGYDELIRLNADGSFDETYQAPVLNLVSGRIRTINADPEGNVLIHGDRGDGTNFVTLFRPGSLTGEPFPYQIPPTHTYAWPRSIVSLGTNEWLIASGQHLDQYREGQLVNSWSFNQISPTTPLQKDEAGDIWFGADQKLHRFSSEVGPVEQPGPANFRLIPGGGFFGVEALSERAGGSVLQITETISRYYPDGTLDERWTPFSFQKFSYYGGSLDILPTPDGGLWVVNSPHPSHAISITEDGEPGSVASTTSSLGLEAGATLFRNGIFRLNELGSVDVQRFIRGSDLRFLGQHPETSEIIIKNGSTIERFDPTDRGALGTPRILRAIPRRSTWIPGESILLDAVIVGSGSVEGDGLREDVPQQTVRLHPYRTDTQARMIVKNPGGRHIVNLPMERQESAPRWRDADSRLRVELGKSFSLPVSAIGSPPIEYSFSLGESLRSDGDRQLPNFPLAVPSLAGSYVITAQNSLGKITHTVEVSIVNDSRLSNLSVRALAGNGANRIILGHVLRGGAHKRTLMRAIGPTIGNLSGLEDTLSEPRMRLRDKDGVLIEDLNQSKYPNDFLQRLEIGRLGAFSTQFATEPELFRSNTVGSRGIYTLEVFPDDANAGIALAELYDADESAARMINLSARALAGQGPDAIMAGFVIAGEKPLSVLIRAIGPTLSQYGVSTPVDDPMLRLIRPQTGEVVVENNDWIESIELIETTNRVGAFPLPAGSQDAAILVTLDPGVYVAEFSNDDDAPAIGLVEIYDATE